MKNRIVWQGFAYNSDEALGDYIFQEIHAREKSIARFDSLEVSPVAKSTDNGTPYCERVENPTEAHFWSLYGHLRDGGVECLEDYDTETEAILAANELLEKHSNLLKHSLLRY